MIQWTQILSYHVIQLFYYSAHPLIFSDAI